MDALPDEEDYDGDSSSVAIVPLLEGNDSDDDDGDLGLDREAELPLVRHHSYLPGASHPLYTGLEEPSSSPSTSSLQKQSFETNNYDRPSWIQELAVLELPDIVLFPGATLPIRLTNREWIRLLGRQIDESQRSGTSAVRLGVLCHAPADAAASTAAQRNNNNLRPSNTQRRRSWARRGYGPTRLRRLSERLIAELGQDLTVDEDEENPLFDRTEVAAAVNDVSGGAPDAQNGLQNRNRRLLGGISISRLRRGSSNNNNSNDSLSNSSLQDSLSSNSAQDGETASPVPQQNQQQSRQQPAPSPRRSGSYLGRIGTIATVIFTHTEDDDQQGQFGSAQGFNYNNTAGPLVVTALGTSRFRIVGFRSSDEEEDYVNAQRQNRFVHDDGVRYFLVEELEDKALVVPKLKTQGSLARTCSILPPRHQQTLQNLSLVCPVPAVVLEKVWPWQLMAVIRQIMKKNPSLVGLERFLPPLETNCVDESNTLEDGRSSMQEDRIALLEPGHFSYWMAANLPLEQEQKLQLLEMMSTIERLRFIRLILEESVDPAIHCKNCMTPFSSARHVFTVDGAEGTTGNYVNEHGIVHQTITVRTVDEDEVWFQGGPEARDSWFPGWTWTIMACSVCGHHLGWKFNRLPPAGSQVRNRRRLRAGTASTETLNRPDEFFGLSAANVSTSVPTSSR